MGCFSFICKKSGKAVSSSSFSGDAVHLFLLKNGKVIEHMYGNYDSYGRVFSDIKQDYDKSLTDTTSFEWNMNWHDVCTLMFSPDESNGIAAILDSHWKEGDLYPTTRSAEDPNQGWGDDENDYSDIVPTKVQSPFHKIFNITS